MKIEILSERLYQHWPSWDVVYEWEDAFCEAGDIKLRTLNENIIARAYRKGLKIISKHVKYPFKCNGTTYKLVWIMNAASYHGYVWNNVIPIFLDFPAHMVLPVREATKRLPFFWVTCYDIYCMLREVGADNVHYMPLSISDKYITSVVPQKDIDVIQFGRKNPVLHQYMLDYTAEHPEVEYVYQTENGSLTYTSTKRGNLGKFDKRAEYFKLMSRAQVSLVSTPGADKSRDFGNIDFVTPRFYESASNYCYMLGRYTENEEAQQLGLLQICPNIQTYHTFSEVLTKYLSSTEFIYKRDYDDFLAKNVTSRRKEQCIATINSKFKL